MDKITKLASLAVFAIIFVTFIFVMYDNNLTGKYTYSGGFKQYAPSEACAAKGCIWDLEVQRGMAIASPHHTPMAGCVCPDGRFMFVPLLERVK